MTGRENSGAAAAASTVQTSTVVEGPLRVLIAASGTGGHLIPALHIAQGIKRLRPDAIIEFIGAGRPLEEKLIVEKGFKRHVVTAAGVKRRGIVGLVGFICKLPFGLRQLRSLYRSFKPSVVVGVGGYVSVLPIVLARWSGIPTWTHEAELHPGLANTVLAHFADTMSLAFEETKIGGRAQKKVTGHPVRPELQQVNRNGLQTGNPKHLLILGGSQGARGLDQAVADIAPFLAERKMSVVHQSRPEEMEKVNAAYKAAKVTAHVVPFIDDMAGAYEWADIIISRAGASTVAEIACVNRPAIFVPYPFQQGTHQTDNAKTLVFRQKALLVEELEPEFGRRLREALIEICNPVNFSRMKEAAQEPRGLKAAESIATGVIQSAKAVSASASV